MYIHCTISHVVGQMHLKLTDIEIFSKELKLVSVRSQPHKWLYMFVFDCLFPCDILIIEYGVTS